MPSVTTREGGLVDFPHGVNRHELNDRLVRFSERAPFPCFRLKKGAVHAAEIVGTVQLGRVRINVLPKTDSDEDKRDRDFLVNMLRAAGYLGGSHYISQASVRATGADPLEAMLSELAAEMLEAASDGAPRRYELQHAESSTIKGRIDFNGLARRLPSNVSRLPIRYSPLTSNNLLAQAVKWVAASLHDMSRSAPNRTAFADILSRVEAVPLRRPSEMALNRIRLTSLETKWQRVLEVGKLLVGGRFIDPTFAGRSDAFGMLFPLQHLFERILRRILSQAMLGTAASVTHRSDKRYLLRNGVGVELVRLKPDYLFKKGGGVFMLADAKWKRLVKSARAFGLERDDLYQVNAYLTRYKASEAAVFVPQMPWMHRSWQTTFDVIDTGRRLHLLAVDIESLVSRDNAVRRQALADFSRSVRDIAGV